MRIHFDIPDSVRDLLALDGRDPGEAAREAILVELYRRGDLTHAQFADFLALDRVGAERLLKKLNVVEGAPTPADLETDRATLDRIFGDR